MLDDFRQISISPVTTPDAAFRQALMPIFSRYAATPPLGFFFRHFR